jgi:hypothetical protein
MKTRCCAKMIGQSSLAMLLLLLSVARSTAQVPAEPSVMPPLWKVDPLGQGTTLPPTCGGNNDRNGPLLIGDPLLDSPPGAPGWHGGVELDIVVPHFKNGLFNTVTLGSGATDTVQLPSAQAGGMVMPKIELGYRWGQASGGVVLSYRVLNGTVTQSGSGAAAPSYAPTGVPVTSHTDLHTFDLDYSSHEPRTVLGVDMTWRVGVRGLLSYNDSRADNGVLAQFTSNHYIGFGPHALVDFRRHIGATGLELFSRVEGSIVWGRVDQRYNESVHGPGVLDVGETTDSANGQVTMLGVQAGVNWVPPWNNHWHLTAGFTFEHFWDLGSLSTGTAAREELYILGGFLRAECRY